MTAFPVLAAEAPFFSGPSPRKTSARAPCRNRAPALHPSRRRLGYRGAEQRL